jgi:hypothetical protein
VATALLAAVEREERVIIFEIEYLKKLKEAVDSKEIKSFERRIRRVGRLENKLRRYHKQIKKAIKKLSEKNFRIARNTTGNKTTSAIKNILKQRYF